MMFLFGNGRREMASSRDSVMEDVKWHLVEIRAQSWQLTRSQWFVNMSRAGLLSGYKGYLIFALQRIERKLLGM